MIYLVLGIVLAFNIIIVLWKFTHDRVMDGIVDGGLLCLVAVIFGGSTMTLIVGAIGSAIVSLYLLISPIGGSNVRT